jgi:Fe-Mn family superoxide dismutase
MTFELPKLPFARDALVPHISPETIDFHYGKHHQTYVTNLNTLVKGTAFEGKSLETIIMEAQGGLFNNAAQVWNHTFYWNCLSPHGGGSPEGRLAVAINKTFGSFEAFKGAFTQSALTNFGSGWTWLVQNETGGLEIFNSSNADLPMKHGKTALMTVDVWEHAYYIDYRNLRATYMNAFWALVNWEFISKQFK